MKKKTYTELKKVFKVGETVEVTRYFRDGCCNQNCKIKKIYFEPMEGWWVALLDNQTIRTLNHLRKV
jgi:hypothetical protein